MIHKSSTGTQRKRRKQGICTGDWIQYLYILHEILNHVRPLIRTFEIVLAEVAASASAAAAADIVVVAASAAVFAVVATSAAGVVVHHTQDRHQEALGRQVVHFAFAAVEVVSDPAPVLADSLAVEGPRIQALGLLVQEGNFVEDPDCSGTPLAVDHLDLAGPGQELSWNAAVEDAAVVEVAAEVGHAHVLRS